jgi:hypothetical protein
MRKALSHAAVALFWAAALVIFGLGLAIAQTHDHSLYGEHPAPGQHDPYLTTKNVSGGDCCHGGDCQRFYGNPTRVSQDGKKGWQFGEWFVSDDRMISYDQLPVDERGYHHICLHDFSYSTGPEGAISGGFKMALCGYVALGV